MSFRHIDNYTLLPKKFFWLTPFELLTRAYYVRQSIRRHNFFYAMKSMECGQTINFHFGHNVWNETTLGTARKPNISCNTYIHNTQNWLHRTLYRTMRLEHPQYIEHRFQLEYKWCNNSMRARGSNDWRLLSSTCENEECQKLFPSAKNHNGETKIATFHFAITPRIGKSKWNACNRSKRTTKSRCTFYSAQRIHSFLPLQ